MNQYMTPVGLNKVKITDALFGTYAKLVADKIIPYQWEALNDRLEGVEKSYCLDNFRVAAQKENGKHRGAIFQDTDAYKWLEAVAFCIENGTGKQYIDIADELIDLIANAQEDDGYLNTYITIECPENRWKNLTEGHELYGAGHLIEAAVAYYNATGKTKILDVAKRFADLIDKTFGDDEGQCKGYPGHQEIEVALVKLYRVTGEKRYLNLANHFIKIRGHKPNYLLEEMKTRNGKNFFPEFSEYDDKYAQTHLPPVEQTEAEGHAVRAVYMYSAMADLALENDDKALNDACHRIYDNIVNKRMYITGGIGSSGKLERFTADYDLPNDRMYCESCASIGLMMFAQRMAALTGQAKFYDTVETALCNTVLAGISQEGNRYFYVNPLEVWPDNCLESTSMSHVKPVRQTWFACACCPPNIARTLASLAQYIYAEKDNKLFINQFISSELETELNGDKIILNMVSDYMQSGKVKISAEGKAELNIRVPYYFENVKITLNGQEITPELVNGYTVININGVSEIVISGEVKARFVAANRKVRADIGKVAIMKGPFVYCLEQTDNGDTLQALSVKLNSELDEKDAFSELYGNMPVITANGTKITSTIQKDDVLYGVPAYKSEDTCLTAVPYALWGNRTEGEMQVWIRAEL